MVGVCWLNPFFMVTHDYPNAMPQKELYCSYNLLQELFAIIYCIRYAQGMPRKYEGLGTYETLVEAIHVVGSKKKLAESLDVSRQAIDNWLRQERPPAERVLQLERLTGINKSDFRPDIYPPRGVKVIFED